jgi:mannose-6-phosphate isomerase
VKPAPSRIAPIFSPRIWGSLSLAPLFPEKSQLTEPLGEAWLTGVDCQVATGPLQGKSLAAAWAEFDAGSRGTTVAHGSDFPLLLKFIFPTDKLSIQVHPDDAYAERHEQSQGGRGKTEMWHIVSATPGAQSLVGLKPGVDKPKFLSAMKSQTLEDLFVTRKLRSGETLFLPAGMPHTMGPGMVVFEVQEYSDLTYRVYDYGRVDAKGQPRELHVEKALEVMHFGPQIGGPTPALTLPADGFQRSLLAGCRYFATERWELEEAASVQTDKSHFDLLVILSGEGTIQAADFSSAFRSGECWLLPANLGVYKLVPKSRATIARAYVPNLADLRNELHRTKNADDAIAKTLFA